MDVAKSEQKTIEFQTNSREVEAGHRQIGRAVHGRFRRTLVRLKQANSESTRPTMSVSDELS